MPAGNWDYVDERTCLDFYNKYLLDSKDLSDQEYFKGLSRESIGELYQALVPLMDKNIRPGKIDGDLTYPIYRLAITNQLVGPWIENSKEENFIGINIYKKLEDQVAGKDEEIFFPEENKWTLSASPLKEFFERQYDLDLDDETYKYGDEGQAQIEIKEDQVDFTLAEDEIRFISFPEIIVIRDLEAYDTYGLLKVALLSIDGYYATDYLYKDDSYKNILVTKTRDQEDQVRVIPLYISEEDLDEVKVKDLIEEFKILRNELPPDQDQVKTQGEEIISEDEKEKDLDKEELTNKDQGNKISKKIIISSLVFGIIIAGLVVILKNTNKK